MAIIFANIKRITLHLPKNIANTDVFGLGYAGVGRDFPEQRTTVRTRRKRGAKKGWLKREKAATRSTRKRISIKHTFTK